MKSCMDGAHGPPLPASVLLCPCRKIGLSLGWVYLFMGVVVGSAVPPIAFCITWNKISAAGAISGALTGLFGAIITWICTAKVGLLTTVLTGDRPMQRHGGPPAE